MNISKLLKMKVAPRGSQPRGGSINHEDVHKEKDQ
jgi:hypothetical protein